MEEKKKSSWTVPRVLIAVVVFLVAFRLATPSDEAAPVSASAKAAATIKSPSSDSEWQVTMPVDPMSGKGVKIAELRSENSFRFAFPYEGDTFARLVARRPEGGAIDLFVAIDRGQILCHPGSCPVRLRLDDGKAVTVQGTPTADHDSKIVFLPQSSAWWGRIRKAKILRVELTIFQNGSPVYEFRVANAPGI